MKRAYLTILILTLLSCPGSAFSHEIMLIDETETPVQQTVTLKAFSEEMVYSGEAYALPVRLESTDGNYPVMPNTGTYIILAENIVEFSAPQFIHGANLSSPEYAANPETFGGIGRQRNLKNQTLRLVHPGGYHLTGERISRLIQHKEFSGSGLGQSGLHFAPRHLNRLSGSIRINRIGHVDHHVAFPCTRKTDRCTRQNCK